MIDSIDFPEDGSCPDCGGSIFRPGPRGGASQNIECAHCKSRFNVTRWNRLHSDGPARIVWAQRIPSEADGGGAWREDLFPKVLE
jgi:hypothetical protein